MLPGPNRSHSRAAARTGRRKCADPDGMAASRWWPLGLGGWPLVGLEIVERGSPGEFLDDVINPLIAEDQAARLATLEETG